jgi:hypothetical protein
MIVANDNPGATHTWVLYISDFLRRIANQVHESRPLIIGMDGDVGIADVVGQAPAAWAYRFTSRTEP